MRFGLVTVVLTLGFPVPLHATVPAMPPALPRDVSRPFSVTLGMGGGFLALKDNIGFDAAVAWSATIRTAVRILADWNIFAGLDYTNAPKKELVFGNTVLQLGVQKHFIKRFYLRAGVGPSWVTAANEEMSQSVGPGWAFVGGLGYEGVQLPGLALGIEVRSSWSSFANESWHTGALNAFATFY